MSDSISGSSPAYVFMRLSKPCRWQLQQAACQGARHIYICSPGSAWKPQKWFSRQENIRRAQGYGVLYRRNTIQAVRVLEEKGMRSSVFEAMMKCLDISRKM